MLNEEVKILDEVKAPAARKIRSFIRREGRLTSGQQAAIAQYWAHMGLDYCCQSIDFHVLFQRAAPIVLEIGFGMGKSLVEMAHNEPEKNFLGIEVHRPGVGACLAYAQSLGLANLRVMSHDAVEVLEQMIPDESLARVQIYFPDPWHKKRHNKRRIIQPAFVHLLARKIQQGGYLHLATDWQDYAQHMQSVLKANIHYKNVSANGAFIHRPHWRPETKFEQRAHQLGHRVWDLMFQRISWGNPQHASDSGA